MEMSLYDVEYCLSEKSDGCYGCKYEKQGEIDCRGIALKTGAYAVRKLREQKEEKENA